MNSVTRSRQMSMEIAGMQAINRIVGEVETLAATAPRGKLAAYTVIKNYSDLSGENIDIGPNRSTLSRVETDAGNGRLVYRFWVPTPGESRYLEDDPRFVPNHLAVGEMYIYLNERIVNDQVLPNFSWSDLSSSPVVQPKDLDLNLNGSYNDNLLINYNDAKQLAITVTVRFYSDEKHLSEMYSSERHFLLTRIKDISKDVDPTL